MNLRKKLIIQYVRQFFGFVVVLFVCMSISLMVLGVRVTNEEIAADPSRLSASDLAMQLSAEGETIRVENKVEKSVAAHNGWMQIMDEQGKAIYTFHTPADIPTTYTPGEWITWIQNERAAPYHFTYWIVTVAEKKMIVLYATPAPEFELMRQLLVPQPLGSKQATEGLQQNFSRENAWYVIYDRDGQLLEQWNHANASLRLDLTEVLQNGQGQKNTPQRIISRYDQESGKTYVVGMHNPGFQPNAAGDSVDNVLEDALRQLLVIMILCIVFIGSWYALRVGKPLLHMVSWIERLSKGQYIEPVARNGRRAGMTRKGKWKSPFAVYKDMFDALAHLSETLRMNEQRQKDMERTREEWISGLSHDLKTPLSSIFGYAAILETEAYEWAEGEVGQFGRTIREKADYMNGLIEDLNLTYRLKNNALPLVKESIEVVEAIRRITVDMVNDPGADEHVIEFRTSVPVVYAEVDPSYFRRIIVNILANAIKHTPAGTQVLVSVNALEEHDGFAVAISDNGPGMDEQTQANLFERYYRGGHTEEDVSGTGLGMAIAKQLVLAHGGEIRAWSAQGKGTTVTMTFPRVTPVIRKD
ncbi:sensor histidine kinase [Brevibacillus reuszeri]|uniref:sensor histidine kinase n=1 Tax=Brevibacillus reuszeri TaxID=54915 RepID=UPI003D1C9313